MSKTVRAWDVDQVWLRPPSVRDVVPPGHPAHLVREPPHHPAALPSGWRSRTGGMVALPLDAYSQGVDASRRRARSAATSGR